MAFLLGIYLFNFALVAAWSERILHQDRRITSREIMLNYLVPGRVLLFW